MEPTASLTGWLSLAVTILTLGSSGLLGLIFKIKADMQREIDRLQARLVEQDSRVETVEDQVNAWQLETLRQHPTKQDLREMEARIIDRVNILVQGGSRSG